MEAEKQYRYQSVVIDLGAGSPFNHYESLDLAGLEIGEGVLPLRKGYAGKPIGEVCVWFDQQLGALFGDIVSEEDLSGLWPGIKLEIVEIEEVDQVRTICKSILHEVAVLERPNIDENILPFK